MLVLEYAVFYFTICMLLASVLVAGVCVGCLVATRSQVFKLLAVFFGVYAFDIALVFRTQFIHGGMANREVSVYAITAPFESILLGGVMMAVMAIVVQRYLNGWRFLPHACVGLFLIGSVAALWAVEDPALRQFLFFNMRPITLAFLLCYGFGCYLRANDPAERARLYSYRHLFFQVAICAVLVVAENVYYQLIFDWEAAGPDVLSFSPERNFMENVLIVAIGWAVISHARVVLRHVGADAAVKPIADAAADDFHERSLERFSEAHGLSKREREVAGLVLARKSNREIADELGISLSTVKVHVHNILKKSSYESRDLLVEGYWSGVM
ncbi:LuxR C-terminal-related transcriptional regulator [Corynebacterium simulans]|uniref:helix-turn-helix transcriptional regulator n=1 Tax=Corynebacterium simulans TaxID=146827 RepID=UPI0030D1E6A4